MRVFWFLVKGHFQFLMLISINQSLHKFNFVFRIFKIEFFWGMDIYVEIFHKSFYETSIWRFCPYHKNIVGESKIKHCYLFYQRINIFPCKFYYEYDYIRWFTSCSHYETYLSIYLCMLEKKEMNELKMERKTY